MSHDDNTTLACICDLLYISWCQIKASWLGTDNTFCQHNFCSELLSQWRHTVDLQVGVRYDTSCSADQGCRGHVFLVSSQRHALPRGTSHVLRLQPFSHATYMLAHYLRRQIIEQHRLQANTGPVVIFTTLCRHTRRECLRLHSKGQGPLQLVCR